MSVPKEDIEMEKIVDVLKNAEDSSSFYDMVYNLYTFVAIGKSVDDVRNGRGMSLEEFNAERELLYESYNRKFG